MSYQVENVSDDDVALRHDDVINVFLLRSPGVSKRKPVSAPPTAFPVKKLLGWPMYIPMAELQAVIIHESS